MGLRGWGILGVSAPGIPSLGVPRPRLEPGSPHLAGGRSFRLSYRGIQEPQHVMMLGLQTLVLIHGFIFSLWTSFSFFKPLNSLWAYSCGWIDLSSIDR